MSGDKHLSDLDGGAGWDECLDHSDASLRCLKQTPELLKGEEGEAGTHTALGWHHPPWQLLPRVEMALLQQLSDAGVQKTSKQNRLCLPRAYA